MLLAFALPFMEADENAWYDYCSNVAWNDVLESFDSLLTRVDAQLDAESRDALAELPSYEQHVSFAAKHFTGGLPQSALPVESLYVGKDAAIDDPIDGPCYLQQTAYYMRELATRFCVSIPEKLAAMPDHLAVELAIGARLLDTVESDSSDNRSVSIADARDYLSTRFAWLDKYRSHLKEIPAIPAFYPALAGAVSAAANALAETLK